MIKKLKDIVVISPLIIAFSTFLGYLKLNIYFGLFHVRITDFIDLSEILTYFMNDLWSIFGIFLGVIIYFLLISLLVILFCKIFKIHNPYKGTSPIIKSDLFKWPTFIISVIITVIPCIIYFHNPNRLLLIPACLYFTQLLLMLTNKIEEKYSAILLLVVVSISLTISLGWYDYRKIISNGKKYTYFIKGSEKVELKNKRIIGITKRFLFIFNDSTSNVTVLKMDEIREIEIKR